MLIGPLHWKLLSELGIRDHPTVTDALDQDETDIFNLMQDVLKSRYSRELALKLAPNDAERFMVLLQSVSLNYVSCVRGLPLQLERCWTGIQHGFAVTINC